MLLGHNKVFVSLDICHGKAETVKVSTSSDLLALMIIRLILVKQEFPCLWPNCTESLS